MNRVSGSISANDLDPNASAAGLRPEVELLLCCARTSMDAKTAERLRLLLEQGLEWPRLIRAAKHHGMRPLLYWNLATVDGRAVPKTVFDQLRYHFHANHLRNRFLAQELLRLLALLEACGIAASPFKGPVLAASIYGNLALREFADLDILVGEQDVSRARALFVSEGYHPITSANVSDETAFRRSGCECCLVHEHGQVAVDLHWKFTTASFPFPLTIEQLLDRSEPVELFDQQVPSFVPEDLLLILCMHGSKHLWTRLEWICGVAELVRARPTMDWERVVQRSHELGSQRMLFLGLLLVRDLLGAALPEKVCITADADRTAKLLATRVRERLFSEAEPSAMEWWGFRYRVRERWRDQWPFLLSVVSTLVTPNREDRRFLPLPASLGYVSYLVRPVRLVRDHARPRFDEAVRRFNKHV